MARRFVSEMATGQAVGLEQVLPWVAKLAEGERALAMKSGAADGADPPPAAASMYRVTPENAFHTETSTDIPITELGAELRRRLASGAGGASPGRVCH